MSGRITLAIYIAIGFIPVAFGQGTSSLRQDVRADERADDPHAAGSDRGGYQAGADRAIGGGNHRHHQTRPRRADRRA